MTRTQHPAALAVTDQGIHVAMPDTTLTWRQALSLAVDLASAAYSRALDTGTHVGHVNRTWNALAARAVHQIGAGR